MSRLQVVEVATHDEAAVGAWCDVAAAAQRHDAGASATPWSPRELLPSVREPDKSRRQVLLAGVLDGEVVAAARLVLRQLDNLDAAEVDVNVRPDVRRRGIGSQVLERAEAIAREDARTRFEGQVRWLHHGPADGAGVPGVEFAARHGYRIGIGEVQRELELPVDEARLASLAAEAAERHGRYRIRTWSGPVPDDLVQDWLALANTLLTEAPAGEMEREEEAADVEAHRMAEAIQAKQGRVPWHAVALDGGGRPVAYSLLVSRGADTDGHIFQWGTLVHRDHRGHRLGLAVKVANLRSLQAAADVSGRGVVTWNAEVNAHMIGINERLGFVPTAWNCELQKRG
ncbi:GNAT family N-acetyltransferase [Nocardioides sp. SYSU DS0651]|uniref:GNAT family N-acetyltransferase n=1 Tax=Nocardioides sp. SYSU DS0651 TaxID=3415955 RepID=UPI003F4B3B58